MWPAVSADLVHQGAPPLPQPFRGDGTLIGIVDTGLSGTHPDFAGRIAHSFSVSGLNPLQDTNGHGTHVTGIAAGDGSASAGTYTGMAPGSRLLVGRVGTNDFQISAIFAAIDEFLQFAGTTPVSINLSLGLPIGPHDGTSSFETVVNSLATGTAGSKRIIAVAAGNERNSNEHFRTTIHPFEIANPVVEFAVGTTVATVEIWADGSDEYSVTATMGTDSFTVPSGTMGSSLSGRISISNKFSVHPNGATLISVTFLPLVSTGTAAVRLTRTRNGGTGNVDGYIDRVEGTFTVAAGAGTITEPANAENVLSVGSFNTKTGGEAGPLGDLSTFSSLGPTRDGRIKPNLTAPGSLIYSARSLEATFSPIEIAPNDNYAIMQGTSMATAHVTGIAPLVWQSNPALTGAQMRERLKRTADLPPDGSVMPNNTWGFGKVNALRAVSASVASITAPATATPGNIVNLGSESSSSAFPNNPLSYTWAFSLRPTGSGASLSSPTAASPSFVPDIPGNYRVSLTVSQASPAGTPQGTAEATVHVNRIPLAAIAGPATDNVGIPVSFSGAESADPDPGSPPLKLWWVLVSRPSGSSASLLAAGGDNATMTTDMPGVYEVGLRADDGLDNSALATKTFTSTGVAPPSTGGGGGGGCSIGVGIRAEDGPSSLAALLLILLPILVLGRGHSSPASRR